MTLSRRAFLGATGLAGLALAAPACEPAAERRRAEDLPPLDPPAGDPETVARDEGYWRRVAAHYRVPAEHVNLEAGYFGMMAAPVLAEFHRQVDRVNYASSVFARREYGEAARQARERLAQFLGVAPDEVVFTRNATEALQRLIVQYNRLRPGDTVLYADLDYQSMQQAMDALAELRGVRLARFAIPEPATRDNVLAAYAAALDAHPGTRLVLLTHLNNKTGLIIPTAALTAMARERGADTIVDAAHSFGQCDIRIADLGADFVGLNLHKWLGTPVGAGAMVIRRHRLDDVDRMLGDDGPLERIDSRMHTGTMNFATILTVPAALDFHHAIGAAAKAARVRYLRDQWVEAVRGVPEVNILTPDDRDMVAAITSFRLHGEGGREANQALVQRLFDEYQLFTVWRTGVARGDCVRVTPALYNTPEDCARLAAALRGLAAAGIAAPRA